MMSSHSKVGSKIFFYDGNCGICSRTVQFLSWIDCSENLRFAPLGGVNFRTLIESCRKEDSADTTSEGAYYVDQDKHYWGQAAVLEALNNGNAFWKMLSRLAKLFPENYRNRIYRKVAEARQHQLKISCELPSLKLRAKLLA